MLRKYFSLVAWIISLIVVGLAFVVWGSGLNWDLSRVGNYTLFPLLGLVAFSLMWAHYIVSSMRQYLGLDREQVGRYFEITSMVVLVAILLHPGLLAWQLFRDGFGLPPASYKLYAGATGYGAVLLGAAAWTAFMLYELRRKYSSKSWWKYVQYASDFAMFLIIIHALRLGSHLQQGWFRGVWYFYGITLLLSLVYSYVKKSAKKADQTIAKS